MTIRRKIFSFLHPIIIPALSLWVMYMITFCVQPPTINISRPFHDEYRTNYIDDDKIYALVGNINCVPGKCVGPFVNFKNAEQVPGLLGIKNDSCLVDDSYMATLNFTIKLSTNVAYSIVMPAQLCEYIIYVNGSECGRTPTFRSSKPAYPIPRSFELPIAEDGIYRITINAITPQASKGGPIESILIGSRERVATNQFREQLMSMALVVILFFSIFYFILQFFIASKIKTLVAFLLLCVSMLINIFVSDGAPIMSMFPSMPYQVGVFLDGIKLPLFLLALMYYEFCMFPGICNMSAFYIAASIEALPIVLAMFMQPLPLLKNIATVASLLPFIFCICLFGMAIFRDYEYSILLGYAINTTLSGLILPIVCRKLIIPSRYGYTPGYLLFFIIETIIMARKYGDQERSENYYTEQLNTQLANMQDSENAFLNAQMKPHFLYNTLNTIADLCVVDSQKAKSLITSLKEYVGMVVSVDNMEKTVPIKRELDLVATYTKIEKERFPSINFFNLWPIRLPVISMPPLTLQPLVENAIKHGVRKLDRPGAITIRIVESFTSVTFYVSDNGAGMTQETIDKLFEVPTENKSVGIYNIDKRLKNLYGTGLTVDSTLGLGTCISFTIPKL